jgi:hypothetical protein
MVFFGLELFRLRSFDGKPGLWQLYLNLRSSSQLVSYFFPIIFAIPLFGNYLAREWLWYFSPSLSYVGQGLSLSHSLELHWNFYIS